MKNPPEIPHTFIILFLLANNSHQQKKISSVTRHRTTTENSGPTFSARRPSVEKPEDFFCAKSFAAMGDFFFTVLFAARAPIRTRSCAAYSFAAAGPNRACDVAL